LRDEFGFSFQISPAAYFVIASEAKQSILPLCGDIDCFASLAMTGKHTFAFPRREAPGWCMKLLRHEKSEGAGKAGCPWHPQSVHRKLHTVDHRYPEHPALPAQWFDGLFRALLGDEFVLSPSLTD